MYQYYPRHTDRTKLLDALRALGFDFEMRPTSLDDTEPTATEPIPFAQSHANGADCVYLGQVPLGYEPSKSDTQSEDMEAVTVIYSDEYCANIISPTELDLPKALQADSKPNNPYNVWA